MVKATLHNGATAHDCLTVEQRRNQVERFARGTATSQGYERPWLSPARSIAASYVH
jgi:hypothetical protein